MPIVGLASRMAGLAGRHRRARPIDVGSDRLGLPWSSPAGPDAPCACRAPLLWSPLGAAQARVSGVCAVRAGDPPWPSPLMARAGSGREVAEQVIHQEGRPQDGFDDGPEVG